jgi:DNA-binding cell septation regulator SpoVG
MEVNMPSRRQRKMDEFRKILKESTLEERKNLKEELAKYPDPPGEEEFKGPYDGPDGEDLRK